jgi:uncharacterized protein (DUF2062 family)
VPLYLVAYGYGRLLVGGGAEAPPLTELDWATLVALGKPLAVGLVALGCTLALLGYLVVQIAWRLWVIGAWRARRRRRRA